MIRLLAFAFYSCEKRALLQSKLGRKQGFLNAHSVDSQRQGLDGQDIIDRAGQTNFLGTSLIELSKALLDSIEFDGLIMNLISSETTSMSV